MNRHFKSYIAVWTILIALFNIICFIAPETLEGVNKYSGSFWSGLVFINVAFIGQLICAYIALKPDNITRLFYNIPMLTISYTGMVVTIIAGVICMAIHNLPNWVGSIICIFILAFVVIAVICSSTAGEIVSEIDEKVDSETLFIKFLIPDAELLVQKAKDGKTKQICSKVLDAIRYSDPVSNSALADIEGQITVKFYDFSEAVKADSYNILSELGNEILILLADRNKKAKLIK